jgi:hypothetical protein
VDWGIDDPSFLDELLDLLAIGHAHFAFHDRCIDENTLSPEEVLLSDVCLLEYLDGLASFSHPDDPRRYRNLHDHYYGLYAAALLVELRHRRTLSQYTSREVALLGHKAAPGSTPLHVVADAAGRAASAPLLVDAVMRLCTGFQMLDDLNDITEDYHQGNLTVPISACLTRVLRVSDLAQTNGVHADTVLAATAMSGVADACIEIAIDAFGRACQIAEEAGAGVVRALAATWRARALERRAAIAEAVIEVRPA